MKYALAIILLASVVSAADFPKGGQLEVLDDFSGGLNTAAPSSKIPKNASPNMRNVLVHRVPGQIIKRGGLSTVGSTRTLASGAFGFTFYKEDGSKEFIVSDDSMVLSTQDFNFYVFVASGLTSTTQLECAQMVRKVFCTNGVDPVFSWDGTTKVSYDGTKGTPNIPRFKYPAVFLNRLWGLNTSGDRTSLNWSAVASTNGLIITPDNFLAWPPANQIEVGGLGDGEVGTALWVYRGQLHAGKTRSIYTIYGDRDSNFQARKTVSQAGVASHDSVVVLDGLTYYKGNDGVYAYNGSQSLRISDAIEPDVESMADPTTQILENIWNTQTEFSRGQFFGSTATVDGFLKNQARTLIINNVGESLPGGQFIQFVDSGAISTGFAFLKAAVTVPGDVLAVPGRIKIWGRQNNFDGNNCAVQGGGGGGPGLYATLHNTNNASQLDAVAGPFNVSAFGTSFTGVNFTGFGNAGTYWTADQINQSSFTIKFELSRGDSSGFIPPGCVFDFFPATGTNQSTIEIWASSNTQFMSEVTTMAMVTAWTNFNSVNTTNGGTINYFIRTATSAVNITTQTWVPITPGININAPTANNYIQWATTMNGQGTGPTPPNIDQVTIDHIEGSGSKDRPLAVDWNNEYWLSVSTQIGGIGSLQYVKSWITNPTPNAWNVLQGMNIRSLFKDGNIALYGGSSSTGTFYRLDFGTNDDGRAIDGFYETPDMMLKGPMGGGDGNWMEKQLAEYWIDADAENGNTFKLGTSLNGGSFTENSVDLSGTGAILKVLYTPNGFGKYFRWRFRNNDVDKGLGLNNFGVVYIPLWTR